MKVNRENLRSLKPKFGKYIEEKKVNEFMKCFGINFAAGHWCAGDFLDRFATTGYNPGIDSGIVAQIERVARAGMEGIEFHKDAMWWA